MSKSYSGLIVMLTLVVAFLLGKYLPEKPKVEQKTIPAPTLGDLNVVGYDYNKQEYIYTSDANKVKELDTGVGITQKELQEHKERTQQTDRIIYIEHQKPITKKEFEYMVDDYVRDNWDDLRDKFDN